MSERCTNCGRLHDGWPDDADGNLCQLCWEESCDQAWWAMFTPATSEVAEAAAALAATEPKEGAGE